VEIRRFGIGQRRPDGPTGTNNVQAAVIDSGPHGVVLELALARHASIEPHSNPNTTWFVIIEGGGFVTVGQERARVFAGEAVLWPAGVAHGATTELSEMRAIVVEFPAGELSLGPGAAIVDGRVPHATPGSGSAAATTPAPVAAAEPTTPGSAAVPAPADGHLVDERPAPYDPRHGEPR
jgi:quercetin dioxygenase-like cupin family protein